MAFIDADYVLDLMDAKVVGVNIYAPLVSEPNSCEQRAEDLLNTSRSALALSTSL